MKLRNDSLSFETSLGSTPSTTKSVLIKHTGFLIRGTAVQAVENLTAGRSADGERLLRSIGSAFQAECRGIRLQGQLQSSIGVYIGQRDAAVFVVPDQISGICFSGFQYKSGIGTDAADRIFTDQHPFGTGFNHNAVSQNKRLIIVGKFQFIIAEDPAAADDIVIGEAENRGFVVINLAGIIEHAAVIGIDNTGIVVNGAAVGINRTAVVVDHGKIVKHRTAVVVDCHSFVKRSPPVPP